MFQFDAKRRMRKRKRWQTFPVQSANILFVYNDLLATNLKIHTWNEEVRSNTDTINLWKENMLNKAYVLEHYSAGNVEK